ncbi:hypothetical protein F53441_9210 [Fusarium austroafricanum]|uniref:Uncharacterized protein n=1 Tax=Fusarium austroafricanum TaxID=2364996 RepID=A0A8H4KDA5_9HYPO|nr:hypothetical protein F53441_9210 [Fusarium austroafricanum]
MSNPSHFVFDLDDIANHRAAYPVLGHFMQLSIREVYVEFLQQGGQKPHVVIRLLTYHGVPCRDRHGDDVYLEGCLLSMDYHGGYDDLGEMTVKLTPYDTASESARAGFRFPRLGDFTVDDMIFILQGYHHSLPYEHQTNLTAFNFVVADPVTGAVDGCRDVVTQWMIRLNTIGLVGWTADYQSVKRIVFYGHLPSWGFHDLIGNNYTQSNSRDRNRNRIVNVTPLPLDRGVFHDPGVRRIENYCGFQLPYNPPW